MPHLSGGKITGSHSTVIDAAVDVVKRAIKLPEVSKISLGIIKQARGGRGATSVKFVHEPTGLRLTVRGNTSVQLVRIYTGTPERVEKALSGN